MYKNRVGNCTNYAAYRLIRNGAAKPGRLGNASDWASSVRGALGSGRVNQKPAVGSIAWWSGSHSHFGFGGAGHVAYVERVSGNDVAYLSDSRWGSGSSRWVVRRGSVLWPEAFLHIKDALASAVGSSPVGNLDSATAPSAETMRVRGWAYDPDSPRATVTVEAWIDGKRGQSGARRVALVAATVSRPDVGRAHKEAGPRHGFDVRATVSPGSHQVRVYARNRAAGGDVALLGGKTIRVPESPPIEKPPEDPRVEDPPIGDPLVEDPPTPPIDEPPVIEGGTTARQGIYGWAAGSHFQAFMGDFSGDGKVDVGLRRISDGTFYWRLGPDFTQGSHAWTAGVGDGFQAFMGDFNGDNLVDVGLRRISTGRFYWRFGPTFAQGSVEWVEGPGDGFQSFMGDFNGDNQVDIGLRRISTGQFYWRLGINFTQGATTWPEAPGDGFQSFMGDFNGDGYVDIGIRNIATGLFSVRFLGPSISEQIIPWPAGAGAQFQSFMGDFNGDGKVDVGLRSTTDGVFYWRLGG